MVSTLSRVYLAPDGGYKGIVVKIDSQVDQDHCQEILDNVKVTYLSSFQFSFYTIVIN